MEDEFLLLRNNLVRFMQQGDITKAVNEYERLISYQRQKIAENPESYSDQARLGLSLPLVNEIDTHLSAGKKLTLIGEGINVFEGMERNIFDNLVPNHQMGFFRLLGARGRMHSENEAYDSAKQDFDAAIKLGCELGDKLGSDFLPKTKINLAVMYIERADLIIKSLPSEQRENHDIMTARTYVNDMNEAISIFEFMKHSSPEDFLDEWQILLTKCLKLRDQTNARIDDLVSKNRKGCFHIYVTACVNLPRDKQIKQDHFHFITDTCFAFELEDTNVIHLNFSDLAGIAWADIGGFFTQKLMHGMIQFSTGAAIHFWISEPGLHALAASGLALTPIDDSTGIGWDQSYKKRAKREGKIWKKNLISKLETAM